jgi:hypothetical protein
LVYLLFQTFHLAEFIEIDNPYPIAQGANPKKGVLPFFSHKGSKSIGGFKQLQPIILNFEITIFVNLISVSYDRNDFL